jgi:hypothetical protein
MRGSSLAGLAACIAACTLGAPPPVALRGPQPTTIAVLPVQPARCAIGLDAALQARGHRMLASAVTAELLASAGVATAAAPAALGTATGADALLYVDVRAFEAHGSRPLREARWDLRWRLVKASTGGELWSWTANGSWRHTDAEPDTDALRIDGHAPAAIGGPSVPDFRDDVDLLSWLHRSAFERLPRASR